MDVAKIKKYLDARPFRPFRLVLPSDREIPVPHPEFMAISPVTRDAMVWEKDGTGQLIDLAWVIAVKEKGAKRR